MITAETVNGIMRFQANGLPVVSLYCRVDPGASRREVRARVDSLLEMYQDEMRDVQTATDPVRKAGNTGESRPEDRIQNRVDGQAKQHFRRAANMIDQLLRSDGYDILVVGGHEYELGEFFRFLPHELRGRVAGTFSADPIATPVAEIRSSAEGVMRRYQHEQDQRLVAHVLELSAAGGLAAVGPEDCLKFVEEDLTRFRETAADLRRRIGDRDEEPIDAAERSALIEAAEEEEEEEAPIDQLEAGREELLRRLGQPIRTNGS